MCGIVGAVNYESFNHKEVLNTINHRGPDHQSSFSFNNLWLGHTRLSIIDLSKNGNQPICFDDDFTLVFNGEIYNYQELGRLYLNKNFHSDSVFLYELLIRFSNKKDELFNIIKIFKGMWSFVFFDKKNNTLFLLRDLFGKKPLYYNKENTK